VRSAKRGGDPMTRLNAANIAILEIMTKEFLEEFRKHLRKR
jgi:hypothetical protein